MLMLLSLPTPEYDGEESMGKINKKNFYTVQSSVQI